jgi:hypothetical protein
MARAVGMSCELGGRRTGFNDALATLPPKLSPSKLATDCQRAEEGKNAGEE